MNEISQESPDRQPGRIARRVGAGKDLARNTVVDFEDDALDDDGFDLRSILQVLLARWPWVLAAGIIGLLGALAYSLSSTPLYRTSATIELNPPTVSVLSTEDDQVTGYSANDRSFLQTQYGLMKSRDLARRVVENLGLAQDTPEDASNQPLSERINNIADGLAANINVAPVPDSRLVNLSYNSANPAEAARIVNGYAEAFIQGSIDRKFDATAKTRDFLADQIRTTRERLNNSEQALVGYARANNIILPGGGEEGSEPTSLTSSSLSSLNSALAAAQQKRIAAEQRFRQAGAITENQAATASLRSEKAGLEAEYEEKSTFLGRDYPEMVRLQARIDALDKAIRDASGSASSGLGAEYRAALAEENALRARVNQLSGNVLDEQSLSVEYKALQREVDTQRSLYDALLERANQIGVVEGVGSPAGVLVDQARVPVVPYSPDIPRNLILGLLLGLGIGMAGAFLYETMTDLIKTADDVRDKLRQPLLGSIPRIKKDDDIADAVMDPISPISEAYGSLLTTLMFSTNQGMPKVLTITSASAAEGKSTTSLVLAKRLASSGKKVVLVDADMRRPSFVFDKKPDAGLSQLLTGVGTPSDHIIRTQSSGLFILPSGPIPPNPSMLLNSHEMREMIRHIAANADHLIIDCPPTLGFTDSALVGSFSDGTLLVVESGRTRRRAALEAISQLQNAQNTILGVVLTKCPKGLGAYDYNYGYYYGSPALEDRWKSHELTPDMFGDTPED